MKARLLPLFLLLGATAAPIAEAYPPAPFHRIYGVVRDERGTPLQSGAGIVILSGTNAVEIVRGPTASLVGPGLNYSLPVALDSGTTAQLYEVGVLRPLLPFTIRVVINGVNYVPLQMQGEPRAIGSSAGQTRLDLTLGVDSDSDGLPDSWEQDLIDGDPSGRLTLATLRANDDLDGDGLSNLDEYLAGTYALDGSDTLALSVEQVVNGVARLRFMAVAQRTYRVTAADDLNTPLAAQVFSVEPSGTSPIGAYRADDSRLVNIYIPVGQQPKQFYKLHVE